MYTDFQDINPSQKVIDFPNNNLREQYYIDLER